MQQSKGETVGSRLGLIPSVSIYAFKWGATILVLVAGSTTLNNYAQTAPIKKKAAPKPAPGQTRLSKAKVPAINGKAQTNALNTKSVAPVPKLSKASLPTPVKRIYNLSLPVGIIDERLIRDVMVGKPELVLPPDGTEAFGLEQTPTPNSEKENASPVALEQEQRAIPSSLTPDIITGGTPPANESDGWAEATKAAGETLVSVAATPTEDQLNSGATSVVDFGGEAFGTTVVAMPAQGTEAWQESLPASAPQISANPIAAAKESDSADQKLNQSVIVLDPKSGSPLDETIVLHGALEPSVESQIPEAVPLTAKTNEQPNKTEQAKAPTEQDLPCPIISDQPKRADPAPATETSSTDRGGAESTAMLRPNQDALTSQASKTTSAVSPVKEVALDTAVVNDEPAQPDNLIALAAPHPEFPSTENKENAPEGEATFKENVSINLPPGSILGNVEKSDSAKDKGVLVIDEDESSETEQTIKYRELPTDPGKTKALVGAKFPVVMSSQLSSKTAKAGDTIEARLKYDLKIGDRLIAKKGSVVYGHINYALKARSTMHSLLSLERWYRNSGCLGISFDEIVNEKNEHIPLAAGPAQTARIVKNKGDGRVLGVNHAGQITGPWSQQLRYKAIRVGLNAAMAPCGVFTLGAMPVALGAIGAANPSFAMMKPVGLNVRHRRLKGFAWGFLSGVPGSFLIEDTIIKGQESIVKPGDEFLAEFKQEFTGEPMTEANLVGSGSAKVHGQVLPATEQPAPSSPQ
jgi:hypothetical protein